MPRLYNFIEKRYYTILELSEALGVGISTIMFLYNKIGLEALRTGSKRKIRLTEDQAHRLTAVYYLSKSEKLTYDQSLLIIKNYERTSD